MAKLKLILVFSILLGTSICHTQVATLSISNINSNIMNNTKLLFGITLDARTSLTGNPGYGQIGYYNANGTIIPEINAVFSDFPYTTIRYPG